MKDNYKIDIYDPKTMIKIGYKDKKLVHRDGDLHQTFHCYVVDLKNKKVLLQKRSKKKETFPGMYDISFAGHVGADHSVLQTLHNRAKTEIGLTVNEENLNIVAIKRFYRQGIENSAQYIDNEINSIYCLFVEDLDINTLKLNYDEVEELKWFSFDEVKEERKDITVDLETYNMLYNYIKEILNDNKSCALCNQLTNNFVAKLNPYSKVGTNQLFRGNNIVENEDFALLLDLLPIVKPIHLLIVPKKHIEGMANLKTKELFDSLKRFVEYNNKKVEEYYGMKPSYFEHGSISGGGNAGNSIFHCHYHLVLVDHDYSIDVEKTLNMKPIIIKEYEELYDLFVKENAPYKDLDYILYENMHGVKKVFPLDNIKLPSQFMRKIIFDANNSLKTEQDWNWKKEVNIDLLNTSVVPLKDIYGVEVKYEGN